MTEYGSGGTSTVGVSAAMISYTAKILAGTNSITVTHNLGRLAKTNQPYGTDDNMLVIKIINEGINSFDVATQGGIITPVDIPIAGSYV